MTDGIDHDTFKRRIRRWKKLHLFFTGAWAWSAVEWIIAEVIGEQLLVKVFVTAEWTALVVMTFCWVREWAIRDEYNAILHKKAEELGGLG